MTFPASPAISVQEFDATVTVPALATSAGAIAGVFLWGPVYEPTLIDSEDILVNTFGPPTNWNGETWFTLSSFMSYGGSAWVVRCADTTTANATLTAYANTGAVTNATALIVKNHDAYTTMDGTFDTDVQFIAKWPGAMGNSLRISACYNKDSFQSNLNLSSVGLGAQLSMNVGSNVATFTVTGANTTDATAQTTTFASKLSVGDLLQLGNTDVGIQYAKITSIGTPTPGSGNTATLAVQTQDPLMIHTNVLTTSTIARYWEFFSTFGVAPGQSTYQATSGNTAAQDELHLVIVDNLGKFSGVPGSVLESYQGLSRATDGTTADGQNNYIKDVLNKSSRYVWFTNDYADAVSNTAAQLVTAPAPAPLNLPFVGGADGLSEANVAFGVIAKGYDMFQNKENITVDLVMTGKAIGGIDGTQSLNYLCDNISSVRRDCVVFGSPSLDDVVNTPGQELQNILNFRNNTRSTSFGVLDSGYKQMYDKYNDVYRWVPLNGDIAGLCAQTDQTNDPWWSPAGFNRGFIKNVVKLAYSPREAERDILYPNNIDPVVTFKGQGTVLYGDKTMLSKPSAFDRINVRRLFITLERAIAEFAKYSLFEFNDVFTQNAFKNAVNPYLRDVKGRRGITDYLVIADSTNNIAQVINSNQFVADIYVRPNYSINFIRLRFTSVPNGVEFTTLVGNFGSAVQ